MIILRNSCPLKYPSWFKINLKFLLEVKIDLSIFLRTKNWTCLITGCTTTDWFKLINSIEKRLWKPYQWIELILLIHHREINMNDFASFYGFQSLFFSSWPIWTSRLWYNQLSNRSKFLPPERWKGFHLQQIFKFILNPLGYFKRQLFSSLIIKYRFSQ